MKWKCGTLKREWLGFLGLTDNPEKTVYARSTPYTHTELGETYWLFDGTTLVHVSQELGGRNLSKAMHDNHKPPAVERLEVAIKHELRQSYYAKAARQAKASARAPVRTRRA